MKTIQNVSYGLHRYRDADRNEQFVLSDGTSTIIYDEARWAKALKKMPKGTRIISSSANPSDIIFKVLEDAGMKVLTAHWHSAGIAKNLSSEEIAAAFAVLPEEKLKPLVVRQDIMQLKAQVNLRQAVMEYRKRATLKVKAVERAQGGQSKWTQESLAEIEAIQDKEESPVDKEIKRLAKKLPECQVLHQLMGAKDAWMSAAAIVSQIQDVRRFQMVSSLWHYAGLHGPNGRRKKGVPCDWNPKLKVALYLWATASMKAMSPYFRQRFDRYRAEERAAHASKCQCSTPDGHSTARAMRKVEKDLLKDFWVEMTRRWEQAA